MVNIFTPCCTIELDRTQMRIVVFARQRLYFGYPRIYILPGRAVASSGSNGSTARRISGGQADWSDKKE
jgi:hypothetical protein